MPTFSVNDRVRSLVDHPDGNERIHRGDTGTVLGCDKRVYYVRWDHNVGGHTCGNRCESGFGWNMSEEDIEPAEPEREYAPVTADEIRVLLGGSV